MKKYLRFSRMIPLVILSVMFWLPFFTGTGQATELPLRYVIDQGNWMDEALEKTINEWAVQHKEQTGREFVIVSKAVEALPAADQLENEANEISEQNDFGFFEGEEYGSIFLFINQVPSSKEIGFAIMPTDSESYNLTSYQTAHVVKKLHQEYAKNKDWNLVLQELGDRVGVYFYPVINELSPIHISEDVIRAASREINAWVDSYDQNIVLLLNEGFDPGQYELYAEDYFISQGYGIGEQQSGVFMIYDDTTGRFDLRFYGSASRQYSQEQLDGLVKEIGEKLEGYDVLNIVYGIERFLDPDAIIPLSETGEEAPSHTDELYVKDEAEYLLPEERTVLEDQASSFYILNGDLIPIFLTLPDAAVKNESDAQNRYEQEYGADASGLAVFIEPVGRHIFVYPSGNLKNVIDNEGDSFRKVEEYLRKQLEKEKYSRNAIQRYQLSLMDYLSVLRIRDRLDNYLIDEEMNLYDLEVRDRVEDIQNAGLNLLIIRKFGYPAFRSADEWVKQFRKMMELSGADKETVILTSFSNDRKINLSYLGENKELRKQIEGEISDEVEEAYSAEDMSGAVNALLTALENKVVPMMQNTEKSGKDTTDKEMTQSGKGKPSSPAGARRGNSSGFWIMVAIGVIVLLIILILILILSGKKKKKQIGHPGSPQAMTYPQTGTGYGQPNAGYPQGGGGYPQPNTAYPQGNYPQGNMAYGQSPTGYPQANTTYPQANIGTGRQPEPGYGPSDANYGQPYVAYPQPNSAYDPANTGEVQANLGSPQMDFASSDYSGYPQAAVGFGSEDHPQVTSNEVSETEQLQANTGSEQSMIDQPQAVINGEQPATDLPQAAPSHEEPSAEPAQAEAISGQTDRSYVPENTGYGSINTGYDASNSGYNQGYTGYDSSNPGYNQGYTGYDAPNSGYNQGYTGYDTSNAGYNQGYTGYDASNPGYNQGYTGYDASNPGYNQGYTGYVAPNSGYNQGYTGYDASNPGYNQGYTGYDASNPGYNQGYTGYDSVNPGYNQNTDYDSSTGYSQSNATPEQSADEQSGSIGFENNSVNEINPVTIDQSHSSEVAADLTDQPVERPEETVEMDDRTETSQEADSEVTSEAKPE